MQQKSRTTKRCLYGITCILLLAGMSVLFLFFRSAQQAAVASRLAGRLSQMRHAAWCYEETHQELPPAFGPNGERRLNWLAFMLQEYSEEVVFSRLDFAKPWSAPVNQDAVNHSSLFREHVRGDGYVICPLRGSKSIWNLKGEPRGRTTDLPNAILFVAVPNASNMKALQPHEVDEQAVLSFLNRGYAVLYVECDGGCGRVSHDGNELTFFEPYY